MESLDKRSPGFTLIELLVVLAIISVVAAAVAIVALPGDAGRARAEARRLAALLESAMRESRASGHPIAWSAGPDRYVFWERGDDGDWVTYPPQSVFRPRALPPPIELAAVRVDGREVGRAERIVFAPQGLRRRVSAIVAGADAWFLIEGDAIGRVTLERVHAR